MVGSASRNGKPSIRVRAPGKINLFLRIGLPFDDGYHDLATAYQAVSLFEEVTAEHASDFSLTVGGTVDCSRVPTDGSNLAIRAARLLAAHTGYTGGARLRIDKNVPVAGGMGGGSADAAATLVACDHLWETNVGRDELVKLGAQLGADVPFAILGGTAVGTGRGDQLVPVLATGTFEWVIVLAPFGLSTPDVYAELDRHRARHALDIRPIPTAPQVDTELMQAIRVGDPVRLAESMENDLQAPALHLASELVDVIELGERSGALAGMVSGSGPTIVFLCADTDAAIGLQVALSAAGHHVVRAHGPVPGARVVD